MSRSAGPSEGASVVLRGRIVELHADGGKLHDGTMAVDFAVRKRLPESIACGDIAEIAGRIFEGRLLVDACASLIKPVRGTWRDSGDWHRFRSAGEVRARNLIVRNRTTRAVRSHFEKLEFVEVETPTLLQAPGHEVHIDLFHLGDTDTDRFLRSSPEHHMKRLLGAGFNRIFQICRCFRRGESTPAHSPEFTMLEWYRSYATYHDIMNDVENLVTDLSRQLTASTKLVYQGVELDLTRPWERITVNEAFSRFANIDLGACDEPGEFREQARGSGIHSVEEQDGWEDVFTKLLIERIEPGLATLGPVFLYDYPERLAALATLKETDRTVAERVEVYIGGLELANGYTELNDPVEQRQRFEQSQRQRKSMGLPRYAIDDEFQQMMEEGMPPAAGIALGVDRLLMLLTDSTHIDQVVAFPHS